MKILQIIPYFCFGGAETMCENLCYALADRGHSVKVVSLYDRHTPISDRMEARGIPIRYLDKKLGLDLSMVPKLTKIFREEQPEAVHTHLDVIKYATLAARLAGGIPCVHTVHTLAQEEAEGRIQKIINKTYFSLGWSTPVALSPEVRDSITAFYGLAEGQVPMVYNGIDLSGFQSKESYGVGENPRIVHVGRFTELKNHAVLLEAFRLILERFPGCCLDLVGDGETLEDTKAKAAALGLGERVRFLGAQENVRPYLEGADLFVLPSRYEGMPMTILEAMAAGLPIVASRVGGIPDMVSDGQSALLVQPEAAEVANACIRLLGSEELRRRLGQRALADSARFSAGAMAERYLSLYRS